METGTGTSVGVIAILKWLFPSLVGSALAVWYKRKDVDWQSKSGFEKFITSIVALIAMLIGVAIGGSLGAAVIEVFLIQVVGFQFLAYFISGLCSLKLIDAIVKNIDPILEIITTGVKDLTQGIVDTIVNKWRNR